MDAATGAPTSAASDATAGGAMNDAGVVDATAPAPGDASQASTGCRAIVALPPCQGMAVLNGGDGFVGLAQDGTVNVYDPSGAVVKSIGVGLEGGLLPPVDAEATGTIQSQSVIAAAEGGGVIATLTQTSSSFEVETMEQTFLTTSAGASFQVSSGTNDGPQRSVAVNAAGRVFVSSFTPNTANPPQSIIRSYDGSGVVVGQVSPVVPGYEMLNRALASGPTDMVYARFSKEDPNSPPNYIQSVVIAYDENLDEKARWTSDPNVVLQGFTVAPSGSLVLVGRRIGQRGNPDEAWIDMLDGTTLAELWSAPSVGGDLAAFAVDVTPSGDLVVIGSDANTSTLWADEYDPTGSPVWTARAELTDPAYSNPYTPFGFDVAVQQDGAILIAGGLEVQAVACPAVLDGSSEGSTAPEAASDASFPSGIPGATYLKPSNTKGGTNQAHQSIGFGFGAALALQGDTLVVGAPYEPSKSSGVDGDPTDESVPGAGAVYVFARSGTTWSQQAYLKPSTGGLAIHFGFSVALDGDTLVAGAPNEESNATGVNGNQLDTSASGAGAVYVFTRSGTTWSQQAYVKSSQTAAGYGCGYGVAVSSDTLAFGCIGDTGGNPFLAQNQYGSIYVFTRSGTTWSAQAREAPALGMAVALQGDVLIAGQPGAASAATPLPDGGSGPSDTGAVVSFTRTGTTWTRSATVLRVPTASPGSTGTTANDGQFGQAVALSNGTLVVGAPLEPHVPFSAEVGALYAFAGGAGAWSEQLRTQPTSLYDVVAVSVAVDGNALVFGGTDGHVGSAYAFTRGDDLDERANLVSDGRGGAAVRHCGGHLRIDGRRRRHCRFERRLRRRWGRERHERAGHGRGVRDSAAVRLLSQPPRRPLARAETPADAPIWVYRSLRTAR